MPYYRVKDDVNAPIKGSISNHTRNMQIEDTSSSTVIIL